MAKILLEATKKVLVVSAKQIFKLAKFIAKH